MYDILPQELKQDGKFCLWKYEQRGDKTTKIPYQVNGCKARSNDINCFSDFNTTVTAAENYDGIGLGIFGNFCAVDIDHCVTNGKLSDMAQDIIQSLNSYTEYSPSGNGIRIIFKVKNITFSKSDYYINNAKIGLEIYIAGMTNKFVTLTGNVISNPGVNCCDREILTVLDKYMRRYTSSRQNTSKTARSVLTDDQVLDKAMSCKNAIKFIPLWNGEIPEGKSHSEADMMLASHLAFWCGGNTEQMDRLFRQSGLMRDKWDRRQSGTTYGNITIAKAAERASVFYVKPGYALGQSDDIVSLLTDMDAYHAYPTTDNGTSRLFADVFKDCLRYVPQRKAWYYYDGSRWQEDVGSMIAMEKCKALMLELLRYSIDLQDANYTKYCSQLQARNKRLIILNDAQSVYPINMSDFDNNRYLLNCNNGTLNLKTREFHEHSSADLITKLAPVDYDPAAESKRFTEFVDEIMSSDKDKAAFLQKSLGYSISGDTKYECMFILFGATTRNGKGTMMESMLSVMGDYGKAVKPETIAVKNSHNSSAPSEDIARLAGVRFANISEPGKGLVINAAQVKSMTGNDTINARFLHENSFDFKPQFKIYINTNYLPVITDLTLFSSNRLFIIPFDRHFEDWEQDKTLKTAFTEESTKSAILNWLIEGYIRLGTEGLIPPESVIIATREYNHDSDKMQLFADECLVKSSTDVRTSTVYSVYKDWCSDNRMYPESNRVFLQSLRSLGEIKRKRPISGGEKTTVLIGYSIAPEYEPLCP